jgi:hypothetical protein
MKTNGPKDRAGERQHHDALDRPTPGSPTAAISF